MWENAVPCDRLRDLLQDEEACIRAVYEAKWPDGFRCARCGHSRASVTTTRTLPLYDCSKCGKQTSLIVGTVFQGTRTPLRKWFQAIWLHVRPESVNARQVAQTIEVTYKTAWLLCHKLRHAMSQAEASALLDGLVRVKEAVIVHRTMPTTDWHPQEQVVLVGATVNEEGNPERVKLEKQNKELLRGRFSVPETKAFIARHVAPKAQASAAYAGRSGKESGKLRLVGFEAEWWLARVFRGIGPKHLQVYLDQYSYGRNRKNEPAFGELLRWCAKTPTMTYPELIQRPTGRANRRSRPVVPMSRAAGS